jgi:hypothetical protein
VWLLDTQRRSGACDATFLCDSHGRGVAGFHLPYPLDMDIVFSILWINHQPWLRFCPNCGTKEWTMEAATTGEIASPSVVDLFVGCFLGAWRYRLSTSDKEIPHEWKTRK